MESLFPKKAKYRTAWLLGNCGATRPEIDEIVLTSTTGLARGGRPSIFWDLFRRRIWRVQLGLMKDQINRVFRCKHTIYELLNVDQIFVTS